MRPYVNITFGDAQKLNTEVLEYLKLNSKALHLLLRLGRDNMQAIEDFTAAQRAFHERISPAIAKISENQALMKQRIEELLSSGGFSDADQERLNELHGLLQGVTVEMERIAGVVTPGA